MAAHPLTSAAWTTFRQTFDQKLIDALKAHIQELPLQQDQTLQELFTHLISLAGQGKRVRPYVAALLFEASGGDKEALPWDALLGIELIHLFALIHDDLIDEGILRHNVETVQTFVARRLQEQQRNGMYARIGESQALLAGDLVYTWAFKHLTKALQESNQGESVRKMIFQLLEEVIVGQTLDVDLTTRNPEPYALIEQKMLYKTARYTFSRPMQVGAALSGKATEEILRFCQDFGDPLGLAFQLQDDWFDLIANEQRTGKTGYRDLEEAQQTFFTCFIQTQGTVSQQERMARLLGHPLTKEEQEAAYTLFTEVGAMKHGELLIEKYFLEAERALQQASCLSEEHKQTLQSLLTFLKTRSA
jgi:geranylgeranyl diphosphate synthase type I